MLLASSKSSWILSQTIRAIRSSGRISASDANWSDLVTSYLFSLLFIDIQTWQQLVKCFITIVLLSVSPVCCLGCMFVLWKSWLRVIHQWAERFICIFLVIIVGDVVVMLHFFNESWAYLRNYSTLCFFCNLFDFARFVAPPLTWRSLSWFGLFQLVRFCNCLIRFGSSPFFQRSSQCCAERNAWLMHSV